MNQNAAAAPVTEKAHAIIDQGANKAENNIHHAVEFTARKAHKAVDGTADMAVQARSQYSIAQRKVQTKVNERPVQVLAVAAGLGVLVGWLASRRNRNDLPS